MNSSFLRTLTASMALIAAHASEADPIIITAQRQETPTWISPSSSTVIDRTMHEERGYQSEFKELFRGQTGLSVIESGGGLTGISNIRMRGAFNHSTLYLVDDVPVRDVMGIANQNNISNFGTGGFQQIEIVRGAQSGLYGSGAIGGVIHFRSIKPTNQHHVMGHIQYGTYNTTNINLEASGPISNGWGFAISAEGYQTDGISTRTSDIDGDPINHEKDGQSRGSLRGRIDKEFIEGRRLFFSLLRNDAQTQTDRFGPEDDYLEEYSRTQGTLGFDDSSIEKLNIKARISFADSKRLYPDETLFTTDYLGEETFGLASVHYQASSQWKIGGGIDYREEDGEQKGQALAEVISGTSDQLGVWGQAVFATNNMNAEITLRHDQHSVSNNATTGKVAAIYYTAQHRVHVSAASGFRAPSLYELFSLFGGDETLEAEESTSLELGYVFRSETRDHETSATLFQTAYSQRIDYNNATFVYYNSDKEEAAQGLELSYKYLPAAIPLSVNLSFTHTDIDENTELALLHPEQQAYIEARYHFGSAQQFYITADAQHIGERVFDSVFDTEDVPNVTLEAYELFGAGLGYEANAALLIYLRADNIADTHYVPYPGYSSSGRQISAGMRAQF